MLQKNAQHALILDIGTVSITAAVLRKTNEQQEVVRVFRQYYEPLIRVDTERFERQVFLASHEIFRQILHAFPGIQFTDARIGLSAPFYVSETIDTERRFENRTRISDTHIQEAITDGEKTFFSHFPSHGKDVEIFEGYILSTLLNGYDTPYPVNQLTNVLQTTLRFSAVRTSFLRALQQQLSIFGSAFPIKLFSFPPVYVAAIADILKREKGTQLFVDIGGDITEVTTLRNGIIDEVETFSFGLMNIAEALMRELRLDYASGVSLLQKFLLEQTASTETTKIEEVIHTVVGGWRDDFEKVCSLLDITSEGALDVYLFGGGAVIADVAGMLQTLSPLARMGDSVKIHTVMPESFADHITGIEQLRGPEDFGIISLIAMNFKERYQRIL